MLPTNMLDSLVTEELGIVDLGGWGLENGESGA